MAEPQIPPGRLPLPIGVTAGAMPRAPRIDNIVNRARRHSSPANQAPALQIQSCLVLQLCVGYELLELGRPTKATRKSQAYMKSPHKQLPHPLYPSKQSTRLP